MPGILIKQLLMERYKQLVETLYTEPKEEEILGTFLQLEKTGEQDLAPVAPKQKKKPKCPPESDKNQKDIQNYFAATPRQAGKKAETKKPKSPNVITIDWISDTSILFVFFLNFFSKESVIINLKRNLCFVLQTKKSVKNIKSVKANFNFFIRKKVFFAMDWFNLTGKLLNLARI